MMVLLNSSILVIAWPISIQTLVYRWYGICYNVKIHAICQAYIPLSKAGNASYFIRIDHTLDYTCIISGIVSSWSHVSFTTVSKKGDFYIYFKQIPSLVVGGNDRVYVEYAFVLFIATLIILLLLLVFSSLMGVYIYIL